MDRRQVSVFVAATLSTLFGCGWVSRAFELESSETRKDKDGVLITKRVFTTGGTEYQRTGEAAVSNPRQDDPLVRDFDAAGSATGSARSAAAVEREKLVPAAPVQTPVGGTVAPVQTPVGGTVAPASGPRVDLPSQIYQPPSTPSTYQPPSTPPTYQPPSGHHH